MEETSFPGGFTTCRYRVPKLRGSGSLCPRLCKAWSGSGKCGDLGEEGHSPREEVVLAQHHTSSNTHITVSRTPTHLAIPCATQPPPCTSQSFQTTVLAQSSTDSSTSPGDVVTVSPTSPTTACYITLLVNESLICFLADTGSRYSILRADVWEKTKRMNATVTPWSGPLLVGVEGTALGVRGVSQLDLTIPHSGTIVQEFVVVETLTSEAILGLDFLETQGATLDFPAKILRFRHGQFTLPMDSCGHPFPLPPSAVTTITALQDLSLPANSEVEVLAKILGIPPAGSCLLESSHKHPPLEVARALV